MAQQPQQQTTRRRARRGMMLLAVLVLAALSDGTAARKLVLSSTTPISRGHLKLVTNLTVNGGGCFDWTRSPPLIYTTLAFDSDVECDLYAGAIRQKTGSHWKCKGLSVAMGGEYLLAAVDAQFNPVDPSAWVATLNDNVNAWLDSNNLEATQMVSSNAACTQGGCVPKGVKKADGWCCSGGGKSALSKCPAPAHYLCDDLPPPPPSPPSPGPPPSRHVSFNADTTHAINPNGNFIGVLSSPNCNLPTDTDGDFSKLVDYLNSPPPPPPCVPNVTSVIASWVAVKNLGVPTDVKESVSVTHTQSTTNVSSESWGHSVEKSVGGGFKFMGFSASAHITGTTSDNVSTSYSQTFEQSTTVTRSVTSHFQPGEVWQFHFRIYDNCHNDSTVTTQDLVQTLNLATPPCCLPGYFADPKNAGGACVAGDDGKIFSVCPQSPPSPPSPSPPSPSPPGAQYSCKQGMCVQTPTGVTKAECAAGCTAQFYACTNSTCVPASSGISKQVCTSMCSHKRSPASVDAP